MRRLLAGFGLLLASAAPAQDAPTRDLAVINAPLPDDQAALKAHVMFLADDVLKGREASSPEFMIAAHYVAAQFYAAGLRPAGDRGGYLQDVPLVAYRAADHGDVVLTRDGTPQALAFGEDYIPGAVASRATTTIEAPVVFVGQGIVAPGYGRDDYAGVDVRGKIVAMLGGVPNSFQSEERAHFTSPATKAEIAARHGAVGVIMIVPRANGGAANGWDRARTTWAGPDGTGFVPGAPILATLSGTGGAKLFAGAATPWKAIVKGAGNNAPPFRAITLPGTLSVSLHTAFEVSRSANVAGLLPGSDPGLKDEVVVLSAHLDHLGVGAPDATGDRIYNGAEDNAVGIASLIEEARRFKASGKPPRRSVLFLAVTAEEKGLIGSDYFARHPTLPIDHIVADVNLDMPILTYAFQDMTVFGADRSTLGPVVSKAVAAMGLAMSPDPDPSQAFFVRSDHYRFVQQGVPAVFLWPGPAGAGKVAWADFLAHHYHQPSDEIGQKLDWAQGVRFVSANYAIARAIADDDARPRWNKGDFFGLLYHGYGAQ